MVHIVSAAETVEEVVMLFVFVSKRLAFPALAGFLALPSCCLPLVLGFRWVAALATLVVCLIRICSKVLLPLLVVVGVMAPIFLLFTEWDPRLPPLCNCAEPCWCGGWKAIVVGGIGAWDSCASGVKYVPYI